MLKLGTDFVTVLDFNRNAQELLQSRHALYAGEHSRMPRHPLSEAKQPVPPVLIGDERKLNQPWRLPPEAFRVVTCLAPTLERIWPGPW